MNGYPLTLAGQPLVALSCGALFWPEPQVLAVSDLHLGKARRAALRGGALLPPYEVQDTLDRLGQALAETGAATVICLGDSFDDRWAAAELGTEMLAPLMAGRRWIWVAGNHDPGQGPGGETVADLRLGPLTFRHVAEPGAVAEISGHYHPKARLGLGRGALSRPCFLADARRIILPAFGTYTGGLDCRSPAFAGLFGAGALAVMTGSRARAIPFAAA